DSWRRPVAAAVKRRKRACRLAAPPRPATLRLARLGQRAPPTNNGAEDWYGGSRPLGGWRTGQDSETHATPKEGGSARTRECGPIFLWQRGKLRISFGRTFHREPRQVASSMPPAAPLPSTILVHSSASSCARSSVNEFPRSSRGSPAPSQCQPPSLCTVPKSSRSRHCWVNLKWGWPMGVHCPSGVPMAAQYKMTRLWLLA